LKNTLKLSLSDRRLAMFRSKEDIRGSHFSIVQVITERAEGVTEETTKELVKAPGLPCRRQSTVRLTPQELQVDLVACVGNLTSMVLCFMKNEGLRAC